MKYLLIIAFIFGGMGLSGQNSEGLMKGNVSFISSQNVYAQFVNTADIQVGDTLFVSVNNLLKPVMIVKGKSTISCVGNLISGNVLSVTNQIFAKKRPVTAPLEVVLQKSKEAIAVNDHLVKNGFEKEDDKGLKTTLNGRISLSSYMNNTSDSTTNKTTRLNLSFNLGHIANSKFSAECDLSVTKKSLYRPLIGSVLDTLTNETSMTLTNVSVKTTDVKVYNLAVKYDLSNSASLIFGRKINSNLANVGAIDGLQYENNGKKFSYGAVVGSRPDTYNYNINSNLLQFGAFVSHHVANENGYMQTSLAAFNQTNKFKLDRRFLYLQHSNSLLKNLDLFCSLEVDLYGAKFQTDSAVVKNGLGIDSVSKWTTRTPINKIDLTSAYISLNYRPWRKLTLNLSYDARKNVYYYETYKNFIDSVLDKETRQGLRFRVGYRPFKYISVGGNAGYRFSTATSGASSNEYGYITYSQVPFIDASFTVDATLLKTDYLSGLIYGGLLSRDFLNGQIYTELSYRHVNYTYKTSTKEIQDIGTLSLSWRAAKKLTISADFEGATDTNSRFQWRSFVNISQRF